MSRAVATVSLDTSVVLAASCESDDARELLRRGMAGRIDIAVSTRVRAQMQKAVADPELAAFVATLPDISSPGRWVDPQEPGTTTKWGSGFYWTDGNEARPEVSLGSKLDDDIIDAHRTSGRDHFVTLDFVQLRRAKALGISAMTPTEMLAVVDA